MKRSFLIGAMTAAAVLFSWVPTQAEDAYRFFMRKDLARALQDDPNKLVDKTVTFTDELVFLWDQAEQRPDELDGQPVRLFHTEHFRCVVPESELGEHLGSIAEDNKDGLTKARTALEEINRKRAAGELSLSEAQTERTKVMDQVRKVWHNAPLVTVFGRVTRSHVWGAPHEKAKPGADTETLTIIVDRVEKPRQRWYQFGLDKR